MSAYSNMILATPGLVGYWRLGESSGDAAPAFGSVTGTSVDITYSAAGALTGDADTAFSFNNTSSRVDLGNPAALQISTGSVEIWMKSAGMGMGGQNGLIVKSEAYGLFVRNNNPSFQSFADPYGFKDYEMPGAGVADTNWHHLVYVFESGASNGSFLYLDGALVLTNTMSINNQGSKVYFGDMDGFGSYFDGRLDEAAIYSTKLSAATIAAHYNGGLGIFPATGTAIRRQFQLRPY